MFKANLFKSALVARNKTVSSLAEECGMSVTAMYNRVNGVTEFTRGEIESIAVAAPFTDSEIMAIFFAKSLN